MSTKLVRNQIEALMDDLISSTRAFYAIDRFRRREDDLS